MGRRGREERGGEQLHFCSTESLILCFGKGISDWYVCVCESKIYFYYGS